MNPVSSNTLLQYSLDTLPDPLQASPAQGNVVYGALSFVVSNGGTTVVNLSQLQFTLPVGALAQELTPDAAGVLWSTSPGTLWNVTMTIPGTFLLVPQSGQPIPVSTDGMVIQFYNIPINQQVGTVAITVNETATDTADPAQLRAASFNVAKFPYGFYFANLTAQVPLVQEGGTVTLTWQGSDAATYSMMWSAESPVDVTELRAWTSPPLAVSTTFLLRASVVFQGETVIRDLSTTVIVANPDLQANTLQVTGTSTLQGATTLGSGSVQTMVNGPLTVAGATLHSGTTTLSGSTIAGDMAVNGALSSGGSATFNNATVNGNVNLNGILVGNSWIGGNAGRVQGYGTASTAVFAFKYDNRNFGNSPTAIQIWCESTGVFKTFVIDHPTRPDMYLVHATLEGPEGAVFYRGSAQLEDGVAVIALPSYFEALTDPASVSVLVTAIDGFDPLTICTQDGRKVKDGKLRVGSNRPGSRQKFDWEVKATRRDQPALVVEQPRADVTRRGDGPYTYITSKPNPVAEQKQWEGAVSLMRTHLSTMHVGL